MSQERGNRREDAHSNTETAAARTMGVQGHGPDTEDDRLLSDLQRVKAADSKMLFMADHGYVLAGAALCFLMGTMVSLVIVWIIILICNRQIALERIHTQTKIAGVYAEYNFRHPTPKKPYMESLARVFNCTTNSPAFLPIPNSDVMRVSNIQTAMALAFEAGMGYTQDIANKSAYSNLFMAIFVAAVFMLLLEVLCIFIFIFCDRDAKEGTTNTDETSTKYSFLIQGPRALHHGVFQVTNSLSNASLQVKKIVSKTTERCRTLRLTKQKAKNDGTDDVTEMTIKVCKDTVLAHSSTFQPYQPDSVQRLTACDLDTHVTDLESRSVGLQTLREHLERKNLLVSTTPDLETVDQGPADIEDKPTLDVTFTTGKLATPLSATDATNPQAPVRTSIQNQASPTDVTGQVTAPPSARASIPQQMPQSDVTAEIRSDIQRRISSTTSAVAKTTQSLNGQIPERPPRDWEMPVSALRKSSQELVNSVAREKEYSLTRQNGPGRNSAGGSAPLDMEQIRQRSVPHDASQAEVQSSVPYTARERELSAASERRQREMSVAAAEARRQREQSASKPSEPKPENQAETPVRPGSLASKQAPAFNNNPFEQPETSAAPGTSVRGSMTGEFFIPQINPSEHAVKQTNSQRGSAVEIPESAMPIAHRLSAPPTPRTSVSGPDARLSVSKVSPGNPPP